MTIDLGPANLDVLTSEGDGMKWLVEENKLNSGSILNGSKDSLRVVEQFLDTFQRKRYFGLDWCKQVLNIHAIEDFEECVRVLVGLVC